MDVLQHNLQLFDADYVNSSLSMTLLDIVDGSNVTEAVQLYHLMYFQFIHRLAYESNPVLRQRYLLYAPYVLKLCGMNVEQSRANCSNMPLSLFADQLAREGIERIMRTLFQENRLYGSNDQELLHFITHYFQLNSTRASDLFRIESFYELYKLSRAVMIDAKRIEVRTLRYLRLQVSLINVSLLTVSDLTLC